MPQGEEKLKRKKTGRRLDMILRKKILEVGGRETGMETDDNDEKLLRERDLKLPKVLKGHDHDDKKKEKGDIQGVRCYTGVFKMEQVQRTHLMNQKKKEITNVSLLLMYIPYKPQSSSPSPSVDKKRNIMITYSEQ